LYKIIGPDGQEYGPVELDVISQWIREGRVLPTSSVIDPIYGTARPAVQIPELETVFNSLPQPGQYGAQQPPQNIPHQNLGYGSQYAQRPGPGPVNNPYGPYGQQPNQPIQPVYYQPVAPQKSKVAAFLLAFFLGGLGVHQFYLGNVGWGVAHLLAAVIVGPITCGASWIIQGIVILIEAVLILTGGIKDSSGQPLT
jgi:TM2 domain-containing membrane protein YozV